MISPSEKLESGFSPNSSSKKLESSVSLISPFGLVNIGNTCYANSAFQLFFSIDEITKYLTKDNNWVESLKDICEIKHIKTVPEVIELVKKYLVVILYRFLLKQEIVKNPSNILSLLNSKQSSYHFIPGEQNDSHEFLNILLDSLNEEIYKLNNKIELETEIKKIDYISIITDLLRVDINTTTIYSDKEEKSTIQEKDLFVYLYPHSEDKTIQDLIDNIEDINIVEDKQKIIRKSQIVNSSKYLIFVISRFKDFTKNNQSIEILKEIKISNKIYSVHSIISHSGSLFGGHYINYSNRNGKWYLFNDSSVSEIDLGSVLNNVSHGSAYVVLYKLVE